MLTTELPCKYSDKFQTSTKIFTTQFTRSFGFILFRLKTFKHTQCLPEEVSGSLWPRPIDGAMIQRILVPRMRMTTTWTKTCAGPTNIPPAPNQNEKGQSLFEKLNVRYVNILVLSGQLVSQLVVVLNLDE